MSTVVPIKDMRDTAKFSELVESSPTPVTVTKNGYGRFVVMRSEDYDELTDGLAHAQAMVRLMDRLAIAEREHAEHKGRDAFEALAEVRREYGI